ncbi:MAG: hypothetical protein RL660_2988 [Bacteroidota bacterium]
MATQKNIQKGNYGEDLAVKYLRNQGYAIVERNWRFGHLELDIVAEKDGVTAFVEVKLRNTDEHGHPEQGVTPAKMRELRKAAEAYIYAKDLENYRFDIIAITLWPNQSPEIVHFDDAFF